MKKKTPEKFSRPAPASGRSYVSQADVPKIGLSEALKLPQALFDDFAGKPTAPHNLAISLKISPTSSAWPPLCGAAIAYGLTEGGYNAKLISLSELGKKIVAPTVEGDDKLGKVEAALKPRIASEFFGRYNRAKLPQDKIALNVLTELGVPRERVDSVYQVLKENGQKVGIIRETATGPFVATDDFEEGGPDSFTAKPQIDEEKAMAGNSAKAPIAAGHAQEPRNESNRVFIAHGKNKEVVNQLREIITFGKMVAIVAEDQETTSKPVPKKVMDEMRSCFAGVIHVESEQELLDSAGTKLHKINENVLIEIGAAMALYSDNYILLVKKGITLPSNLQGLYLCYYDGEKLDADATMRLLKAFNDFK